VTNGNPAPIPIEQQRPRTEWGQYEQVRTTGVMKSEYDLKTYLLDVPKDINFENVLSMVTKELDTSFINDINFKTFYQILFENVLEWASMGLKDLAATRLAKLFAELKLEKSVGGFERILQGSTLTGTISGPLPRQSKLFPITVLRKKEPPRTLPQMAAQGLR